MRNIFLPTLKSIKIKNFTLYPNGLDFEYDFINGVNLIIGGNGMGKTTFVNLIKYSIIGHYKKDFDFTRTYKDRKIEKRTLHPINYYKNRQDEVIKTESKATVTIDFKIKNDSFSVERCLETITLNSYSINNYNVEGDVLTQVKYENLNEDQKKDSLLKKYENDIERASGLPFDDLIFFVNEILFFGEDHKTILWNDGDKGTDVQYELFNKYFNSPELDKARQEAVRQAKYFDSVSRHRSEDIRAIKKVLDKVEKDANNEEGEVDAKSINSRVLEIKIELQNLDKKIKKKQKFRKEIEAEVSIINNKINELSLLIDNLEKTKKIAENKLFENKYIHLHKNYDLYYQSIKTNHVCPLCTKEVEKQFIDEKLNHSNNCILCNQEISQITNESLKNEFESINNELIDEHTKIQNSQKEAIKIDKTLKKLDKEFKELSNQKRNLQSELRNLQFALSEGSEEDPDKLQAFYDEIESLEELKEEFQLKSKEEKEKANEFSKQIEKQVSKVTSKFSKLFSEFAVEFLGVKCTLTYDDLGDGKRFYPVINGKIRRHDEELSESQRFFIDHSFRMSILSFFYTKPSFYIVETPDSSLDISYEKNAAKVFTKFLEKDNALIITTNLNNSEFLNHLIDFSENKISIINLLDIAKKSVIQQSSESLKSVYEKVKKRIK
ncbi:AAA family ATPase [Kordia sp.]|uniref:AAA family ATPase n=1 Tax=Kordia sp. TaxID=1965332 RepID=UPI003D6B88FC